MTYSHTTPSARPAFAAGAAGALVVAALAVVLATAAGRSAAGEPLRQSSPTPGASYDHHDRDDYEDDRYDRDDGGDDDDYGRDRDRDQDRGRKRDRRDDRKRDRQFYERVPDDARLVDEGKGELTYAARRDGRIYLYDPKLEKVIYTGRMWRGEEFVTDPPGNRVLIDGKTVMDEIMKKKNVHELYFLRD